MLINFIKFLNYYYLLISRKWTLFEGVKDSIGNGSRFYFISIGGHGKLNQQMAYTTLAQICSKEHLYLISPLFNKNFQIVFVVKKEMSCLKTSTWYKLASTSLESYHKGFIVIQSLNTHSLTLHFEKILTYIQICHHLISFA